MLEQIVLGTIQGITEWLPVSSEGLIVLAKTHLFHSRQPLETLIQEALFLHLGTFLAALIYLRRDVFKILQNLFHPHGGDQEIRRLTIFLVISTIISGLLGIVFVKLLCQWTAKFESTGRFLTFLTGVFLLVTAFLQFKAQARGYKNFANLTILDGIILGIVQGLAVLPGLSRSGTTVAVLLLRRFDKTCSLEISFLMSLPIVLAGNILTYLEGWIWSKESLAGLACAFILGLATIHLLLKLAQKINFGFFVLGFGLITILAAII